MPATLRRSIEGTGLIATLMWALTGGGAELPERMTHIYKRVGPLEIKAEVYQPAGEKTRPAVVWLHGGALINGNRHGVSAQVRNFAFENGYVLVSFDYRLAPETKLPGIIEDLEDAFKWLRAEGPKRFGIDPERIAVTGGSAGGYLTLAAGHRVRPAPRVLLALWGYGDLVGDWYSKPSPHPRHNQKPVSAEEAWRQVNGPPVADASERKGNGGLFYVYCRQQGLWPKLVSGWDPVTGAAKFNPFMPVKNVTPKYPPTVMIHGTKDTDVPYEQSVMMAREFTRTGVSHLLLTIADAEHGLAGGDKLEIESAYRRAFEFVKRELER